MSNSSIMIAAFFVLGFSAIAVAHSNSADTLSHYLRTPHTLAKPSIIEL
jgi:hypothetical protein